MVIELKIGSTVHPDANIYFAKDDLKVIIHDGEPSYGHVVKTEASLSWFTQLPIFSVTHSVFTQAQELESCDLRILENELSGISVSMSGEELSLLFFSARLSRPRVYFLQKGHSLFLSCDMRDLLVFSSKVLSLEIAYSILKFGESPEFHTLVEDIKAVPVGCFLELKGNTLISVVQGKELRIDDFTPYHQIAYPQGGGNLESTKDALLNILGYLDKFRPALLVSGGIDSSLINYLYNEVAGSPYPVFYFDFEEAAHEKNYVIQSLENTRGELVTVPITNRGIVDQFERSVQKLIYPVYDNGSALVGQIFSGFLDREFGTSISVVDGTLADSCYGVRDYTKPLTSGGYQPVLYSMLKEWTYARLELNGIRRSATRPRDSFLQDEFLQDLLWYGGVYSNLWFRDAGSYTASLREKYYWYVNMLGEKYRGDYWSRYTVLKMLLYAAKQTTVKAFDMLLPNSVYFPFMFKTILDDQGKYTWAEKSANGVAKAPLKKILEKYAPSDFIYRKKMGLQSQTKVWLSHGPFKGYIEALIFQPNSVADKLMGGHVNDLQRAYRMGSPPQSILSLVLSLAVLQYWANFYGIKLQHEYSVSS